MNCPILPIVKLWFFCFSHFVHSQFYVLFSSLDSNLTPTNAFRSAASILKAKTNHSIDSDGMLKENEYAQNIKKHHDHHNGPNFPFGKWFSNSWSKEPYEKKGPNIPIDSTRSHMNHFVHFIYLFVYLFTEI